MLVWYAVSRLYVWYRDMRCMYCRLRGSACWCATGNEVIDVWVFVVVITAVLLFGSSKRFDSNITATNQHHTRDLCIEFVVLVVSCSVTNLI